MSNIMLQITDIEYTPAIKKSAISHAFELNKTL